MGQDTLFEYGNTDPLKITKITDPFGRTATISYDTKGRLKSITDAIGLTSSFDYDSETFIKQMNTPYGSTQFSYGQNGNRRWLVITDSLGEKERVEYRHNAPGIPFSDSPLPGGMNLFNRFINSRNTFYWDKEAMKRAPGDYKQARIYHWYHYRGDTSTTTGVLESIKNPLEYRIWYNYPGQGWAGAEGTLDKPSKIARVLQDGSTQLTQKSYNHIGNLTKLIDPEGREYRFDYDNNNIDVVRIRRKNGTVFEILAEISYNNQHRPLSYTGPDNQLTTFTYNTAGQIASQTNALEQTTAYTYDDNGYLLTMTDPNDHVIARYNYDTIGRISSYTNSSNYTLKYNYDALDRLVQVTYPDNTYSKIIWDKLDVARYTDRHGDTTQYTYNEVRNLIREIDPALNETHFDYFANDLLASVTDAKTNITQVLRDIQGRMSKIIHADETETTYAYDKSGRQIRTTDPDNGKTEYGYAKDDRLTRVKDPNGNTTRYRYNSAAELMEQDSPDTGLSQFTYDLNGNRITQTDAKNQTTVIDHDKLNRIKKVTYSDGQVVDYIYDLGANAIGLLSEVQEDSGVTIFEYNEQGLLSSKQQTSPDGISLKVSTTYTAAGLPETVTYPSGAVVSYKYQQDRLSAVFYNNIPVLEQISYAKIGKISGWKWGNGLTHSQDYDPLGLLEQYSLADKVLSLSYDALGDLLTIMGDDVSEKFTYDKLDRLKTAESTAFALTYDYDPNSNRIQETDATQIIPTTYLADSNRMATHDVSDIQYDANGSIINNGRHIFEYDARGRLKHVDGTAAEYFYNDFGQRIAKMSLQRYQLSADLNKDGEVTQLDIHQLHDYIHSDTAPLEADLNQDGVVDNHDTPCIATLIGESKNQGKNNKQKKNNSSTRGNGGPHACHIGEWITVKQASRFFYNGTQLLGEYESNGSPKQENIWLGGQLVATIQNGQLYYVHTDQIGAPRAITDEQSKVVWRWDPRPFGDSEADEDPDQDRNKFSFNLRFPGQYVDVETGLFYNYHRYYDPSLGRYITSDPIGLGGGLNTYAYVESNPLNLIDPFGLWSITISGYDVIGGQFTFGRDPKTGGGFIKGRIGVGVGGGIVWDPNGGRPGALPSECDTGGYGIGLGGSVGGNVGPLNAGLDADAGVNYNNRGDQTPYLTPPTPSWGIGDSWGIQAGANAGIEGTLYSPANPTGNKK